MYLYNIFNTNHKILNNIAHIHYLHQIFCSIHKIKAQHKIYDYANDKFFYIYIHGFER